MEQWLNPETLTTFLTTARHWLMDNVFVVGTVLEFGVVLAAAAISWLLARPIRAKFKLLAERHSKIRLMNGVWQVAGVVTLPALWLLLQRLAIVVATALQWRHGLLIVTSSLLTAWIVIRVATSFIKSQLWSRAIAAAAWTVAALNIVGLLDQTIALLDRMGADFGNVRISALVLIKGVIALAVLLWVSSILSNIFESRIKSAANLTPSVQVLFSKLFKIVLIAAVVLAAVSSVGIDITAFAVFGGAIGVGIGFGLQKIVSNLISGLILLLDKSIKPGDVVAIDDTYGRVDSLGARYVSVTTRDGIEHLIPNEDLIANRVENWSHSDNYYRVHLPIGVHYKSDVPKAMALCLEAAKETVRILDKPDTTCLVRGFGDSSVDLEVRYWISDPMNGLANVSSEVLLKCWEKFHAHDIEIPYPQRDLHIRTPDIPTLEDIGRVVHA